jgi:S-adenosylmethionine synthetase
MAYFFEPHGMPVAEYARKAHPDRFANTLSEILVLHTISIDPTSRVDVASSTGYNGVRDIITINGNVTTKADVSHPTIRWLASDLARGLGYSPETGFDPENFILHLHINSQSEEIATHADNGVAADSRPCYGYACNETPLYLPKSAVTAKRISNLLDQTFNENPSILGPDGKTQVVVHYREGKPIVKKVVVHAQRREEIEGLEAERYLAGLINPVVEDAEMRILPFIKGGPRNDKAQSGTKTGAYGEGMPHGGGSVYGLDPTKPEVYGNAIARHIAKSIVAAGLSESCKVHLAYTMGDKAPGIFIESPDDNLYLVHLAPKKIPSLFPLTAEEAIREYRLRDPEVIKSIIENGFIGNCELPWEKAIEI